MPLLVLAPQRPCRHALRRMRPSSLLVIVFHSTKRVRIAYSFSVRCLRARISSSLSVRHCSVASKTLLRARADRSRLDAFSPLPLTLTCEIGNGWSTYWRWSLTYRRLHRLEVLPPRAAGVHEKSPTVIAPHYGAMSVIARPVMAGAPRLPAKPATAALGEPQHPDRRLPRLSLRRA